MPEFKDLFISYGRRESLGFVARLHQQLKLAGYDAWFDKINIPHSEDYVDRINHGIESAHNFIYVMAPHSLCSPYCLIELEYARLLGKRVIPIDHHVVSKTDKGALPEEAKQVLNNFYQAYGIENPQLETYQQLLKHSLHNVIDRTNWLQGKEILSEQDCVQLGDWAQGYENKWHKHEVFDYLEVVELPQFGQAVDSLHDVVVSIKKVLERHKSYVHQHTLLLHETLEWQRHQRVSHHLLVGKERERANNFLLAVFSEGEQAPCTPSALMCEFVCESRKHSENKMTDCFICYATADKSRCDEILHKLSRHVITTWRHDRDIEKGEEYQQLIHAGIEAADNVLFLISPDSAASSPCYDELVYAQALHKRIIPLLITPTPSNALPPFIRDLQYIDLSSAETGESISDVLPLLQRDREYNHYKILLTQATALESARGQLSSKIFLCYSHKDKDFAQRLNLALQKVGSTVWFDQEYLSIGLDFETELNKGIDRADNFIFIISPDSVNSEYCNNEIHYAITQHKRIFTVLARETDTTQIPKELNDIQYLDFVKKSFDQELLKLIYAIKLDQEHAYQHTLFQQRAMEWENNNKNKDYLLGINICKKAEKWLKEAEGKKPTVMDIQQQYIKESREEIKHKQQKKKRQQYFILIILVITLVSSGLSLLQMEKVKQQRNDTLNTRSIYLATTAQIQVDKNKPSTAIKLILDGLPRYSETEPNFKVDNKKQQRITHITQALYNAVLKHWQGVLEHDEPVKQAIFTSDGKKLVTYTENSVYIWDKQTLHLLHTLKHEGYIKYIVLSPNGKLLSTISENSKSSAIHLWSTHSGKVLHTFEYDVPVTHTMFSPNGMLFNSISGNSFGENGTTQLWNVQLGKYQLLHTFNHNTILTHTALSPNGRLLGTTSYDNTVRLWDIQSGKVLYTFNHESLVYHTVFSPNSKFFSTISDDNTIRLWDNQSGKILHTFKHDSRVQHITFSPDSSLLSTASDDNTARLWDIQSGKVLYTFKHSSDVNYTSFSPNGRLLSTASKDNTSRLWDTQSGKALYTLEHNNWVQHTTFSPNGRVLSTSSDDNTTRLWSTQSGKALHIFKHNNWVQHITFSPNGKLLSTASRDNTARLWDIQSGKIFHTFKHNADVNHTTFSPDGRLLSTSSNDNTVRLWDTQLGKIFHIFQHNSDVNYTAFSPDSRLLSTASSNNTAYLWDIKSGKMLYAFKHKNPVYHTTFSPDGRLLSTASSDKTARLWNTQSGKILHTFKHEGSVYHTTFSSDNRLFSTASRDNNARLWDIQSGKILHIFQHDSDINHTTFSPNNRLLSTASLDNTVRLWDTQSGDILHTFKHDFSVNHTAFSSDSRLLGTISDKTIYLWDVLSGQLLYTMKGHQKSINYIVFSPDGKQIATASKDGTARLWLVFNDLGKLAEYAKNLLKGHPLKHHLPCSKREEFLLEEIDRCKKEKVD